MFTQPICSFLFLFLICCFTIIVHGYIEKPISFQSTGASGTMKISGSLFIPNSTTCSHSVVLISGSGPNNRYERDLISLPAASLLSQTGSIAPYQNSFCYFTTERVQPFFYIATHLADTASACVLTYDKRTCIKSNDNVCQNELCIPKIREENCLNATHIEFMDFVTDAKNAVLFLKKNTPSSNSMSVIGHSQGCTIAPLVANQLPLGTVDKTVLLMGAAVPVLQTMARQYSDNYVQAMAIVNGSFCDPSISWQANILNQYKKALPSYPPAIESINKLPEQLFNGFFGSDPFTIIRPDGVPPGPLIFYQQWQNQTETAQIQAQLSQFLDARHENQLYALNSPQDLQVSIYDFYPLRVLMNTLKEKFPNNVVHHKSILFLTHFMTDADFSSGNVRQDVLDYITNIVKN